MSKKKTVKKTAAKKAAKKSTTKKTAKKVAKTAAPKAKKAASTKKVADKGKTKPLKRKSTSTAAEKNGKTRPMVKREDSKESADNDDYVLNARKRKSTPAIFKIKSRKNTPIVFTLDDVQEIIERKKDSGATTVVEEEPEVVTKKVAEVKKPKAKKAAKTATPKPASKAKSSVHGAASIADILGFNPTANSAPGERNESEVPKKWIKYYRALVEMREHVLNGLDLHTKETLHRSSKEDSGDLSNYGQHMADAGTENSDRDFALSLVSSEQEALAEVEAAIDRIFEGTYGVCEITGETIKKERLTAVPFTRYSLEGQRRLEGGLVRRRNVDRGGAFTDIGNDETVSFSDDGDE